jgi:iron(III) transport system permease protein
MSDMRSADVGFKKCERSPAGGRSQLRAPGIRPSVVILGALLMIMVLPPVVYIVNDSFHTTGPDSSAGSATWENYRAIFSTSRFYIDLLNSCLYSVGSGIFAVCLGIVQAWIVERTDTPGGKAMYLVAIMSLAIPNVLYCVSWLLVFGKSGPINDLLRGIFGTDDNYINIYSMTGMIVVEGFAWAPLAFLLVSSSFRNFDAALEEVAAMSGASIYQTFRRITLKLSTPAIMALALLIVVRAFESFEVPALIGIPGNVYVISTSIFDSVSLKSPPQYGQASAFSVVLLCIVMVLLRFQARISRSAQKFQTISGRGFRPRVLSLGRWRWLTGGILLLLCIILIAVPVGMLSFVSLQSFYAHISLRAIQNATLENYVEVLGRSDFRNALVNTLVLGFATATAVTGLAGYCAWLVVRRVSGAAILDPLATLPLTFPAIVVGVAFLEIYLRLPIPLYGQLAGLIFASVVAYLPYGMRYSTVSVLQIDRSLEEAAASSGAEHARIFARIVLPLMRPGLLTCWLFLFLVCVRGVAMAIMLTGPNSQVVASTLFDLWQNGQTPQLAAMGVLWMALMSLVCVIFYGTVRRSGFILS